MNTAPTLTPQPSPAEQAENELLIQQALRLLPAESLIRVLQSLPPAFLKVALETHAAQPKPTVPVQIVPPPAPAPPVQQAAPVPANPSDKRASPRHRTLRGAKIVYNNRVSVVDAQVRDISQTGCRLRVATAAHLPASFFLQITGMTGEKRCEVRWRNDGELGVRFLD